MTSATPSQDPLRPFPGNAHSLVSLAIDVGQTGFRARAQSSDEITTEHSGAGYQSASDIDEFLVNVVRHVCEAADTETCSTVVAGMTGLFGCVPSIDDLGERLRRAFGVSRLVVADDAVTSFLGAMNDRPGVVVAAGTGMVALGRSEAGGFFRVDGAGHAAGDEGGGWWIGRKGLIAALATSDGRSGGSLSLLAAAEARFGRVENIPAQIATSPSPIAAVAGFARDVATCARDGDQRARKIWAKAARFQGRAIAAAAVRAALVPPISISMIGGVSRSMDLLEPHLSDYLHRHLGDCIHVQAHGDGLDGAETLLHITEGDDSELIRQIASSGRIAT